MMSHDNCHTSSWLVGESMKRTYQVGRQYRPRDIITDIRNKYGVQISYDKAWRVREFALNSIMGSLEESYGALPCYCYMLEQKNSRTITDIVTDVDNQFKYLFMAFGACIYGFRTSIRPIIVVDGTFLKLKYLGTLFIAASKDGNNQIYPLAFGIGDLENDTSWEWFLTKSYEVIGYENDLVVVSDCHGSIEKVIRKLFPHASHGVCTYHLGKNLKTKFKNVDVHKLFHDAAHAYRTSEFDAIFGQLQMISPRAAIYLADVGVEQWARSHSNGKRYNIMTIGIIEFMNVVMKYARWF